MKISSSKEEASSVNTDSATILLEMMKNNISVLITPPNKVFLMIRILKWKLGNPDWKAGCETRNVRYTKLSLWFTHI